MFHDIQDTDDVAGFDRDLYVQMLLTIKNGNDLLLEQTVPVLV